MQTATCFSTLFPEGPGPALLTVAAVATALCALAGVFRRVFVLPAMMAMAVFGLHPVVLSAYGAALSVLDRDALGRIPLLSVLSMATAGIWLSAAWPGAHEPSFYAALMILPFSFLAPAVRAAKDGGIGAVALPACGAAILLAVPFGAGLFSLAALAASCLAAGYLPAPASFLRKGSLLMAALLFPALYVLSTPASVLAVAAAACVALAGRAKSGGRCPALVLAWISAAAAPACILASGLAPGSGELDKAAALAAFCLLASSCAGACGGCALSGKDRASGLVAWGVILMAFAWTMLQGAWLPADCACVIAAALIQAAGIGPVAERATCGAVPGGGAAQDPNPLHPPVRHH